MQDKTIEELNEMKSNIDIQLKQTEAEEQKLFEMYHEARKNTLSLTRQCNLILCEIERREISPLIEELIQSYKNGTQLIENFEILTDDELSIITLAMDKTDYTTDSADMNIKRFNSFEDMCNSVIKRKMKEPNLSLWKCRLYGELNTFPPESFYEYVYKDDLGNVIH